MWKASVLVSVPDALPVIVLDIAFLSYCSLTELNVMRQTSKDMVWSAFQREGGLSPFQTSEQSSVGLARHDDKSAIQ